MVFESVNYQCPHCGGSLHYDGQKNRLVCEYCDTEFEVAQIEALFAEKEEQATRKAQAAEHRAQDAEKQAAAQHTTGQNSPTAHQQATSQNSAAAAPQGAGQSFTTVESQPNGWAGSEAEGQTDEQAYRIIQEALLNSCKYSGTDQAYVSIKIAGEWMEAVVSDHGNGFDVEQPVVRGSGCGLSGMRERASLIGAQLSIESGPDGTTVTLLMPASPMKGEER